MGSSRGIPWEICVGVTAGLELRIKDFGYSFSLPDWFVSKGVLWKIFRVLATCGGVRGTKEVL